jgi:MFS family permease
VAPAPSLISVLRLPDVARTLVSSLLGRLPYTAIGLLLILRVRGMGGSYAEGGAVVAAFALGLAAGAPLVGRMVDRRGQTLVLMCCAIAASLPLLAVALVPDATPILVVGAVAALSGLLHPPLSGCMRALWSTLVPEGDSRHAAFALESSALELTFVIGPVVLVGGLAAATSPGAGLAACAVLLIAGTWAFATTPSSRRWRPAAPRGGDRSVAGALASPALLVLLLGVAFVGASFGAIELAVTAFAEEHGSSGLAGPLLGAWAAGSLVGGLVAARSGAPAQPARRVLALLAATAVADALLIAAPSPWALAVALLLAGSFIAPAFATLYGMVPDLARAGTLTESYTWLTTGISIGAAAGSALAGAVVAAGSSQAGLAVAAALVALGALSLVGGRRRLGPRASVAAAA